MKKTARKVQPKITFELTTRQYRILQRLSAGFALTAQDAAQALLVGSLEAAMALELAQTRTSVKSPSRGRRKRA